MTVDFQQICGSFLRGCGCQMSMILKVPEIAGLIGVLTVL